jgi:hypothetical protein
MRPARASKTVRLWSRRFGSDRLSESRSEQRASPEAHASHAEPDLVRTKEHQRLERRPCTPEFVFESRSIRVTFMGPRVTLSSEIVTHSHLRNRRDTIEGTVASASRRPSCRSRTSLVRHGRRLGRALDVGQEERHGADWQIRVGAHSGRGATRARASRAQSIASSSVIRRPSAAARANSGSVVAARSAAG